MSEEKQYNLSPEEEELLLKLNNHKINEIDFEVTEEGLVYKGTEDIAKEYNPLIFRRLLNSLSDKGFLERKENKMIVFCPKCNSPDVYTNYACTRCKSTDIVRKDFIEHSHCGYIDDKSKFEKELRFVCPNCDTDLGLMDEEPPTSGKESYSIIGSSFICNDCGHNFERPHIIHECQKCGAVFNFKQSKYEKVFSYTKVESALDLSPEHQIQKIKDDLVDLLDKKDVKAEFDTVLKGQSNGDHNFDITIRGKENLLVGDISLKGTAEELIKLFGKKVDVHAKEKIPVSTLLIDLSDKGEVTGLGDVYDIKIIRLNEDYENTIKEYIDSIFVTKKSLFGL
jgi:uncharacterized OB-fold protein